MPSTIEQFIYGSLFSFLLCGFMSIGFFLIYDQSLKGELETNHDLHEIFENFPSSKTISVVIDGRAVRALVGESEDYEEAKKFCESNNASLPRKKLDFKTSETRDYWVDIQNTSAVEDPELLETIKNYESSLENNTVVITKSSDDACMYAYSNYLSNRKLAQEQSFMYNEKMYNYQFICKKDIFDEFNRAKIINDYKIDCEQFQINSTFFYEYNLWNRSKENITWVFEDRKLSLTADELNRNYDEPELPTIGFELSEDLESKTGFKWCTGTQVKPQGIYWAADQQEFVLFHGSSRFNRQFLCISNE